MTCPSWTYPVRSVRPNVVFKPTTPQREAGIRTEPGLQMNKSWKSITVLKQIINSRLQHVIQPPASVPKAAEQNPEATSATEPEEEPPVYLFGLCGFPGVLPQENAHYWFAR